MRTKGAKQLKCSICGRKVGWQIPTGKYHHGIHEVTFKMNEGCIWTVKYFRQMYYCSNCKPSEEDLKKF